MNKILAITLLSLLSAASFAKTCVVAASADNPSDFDQRIATYTDIDSKDQMIMTVIKENGEILRDLNIERYFDGATTQDEIDARTAVLVGSKIAMISIDKEANQITLAIGTGTSEEGELLKSNTMSLSDLSSSKSAVFDMEEKLAIYCLDQ